MGLPSMPAFKNPESIISAESGTPVNYTREECGDEEVMVFGVVFFSADVWVL